LAGSNIHRQGSQRRLARLAGRGRTSRDAGLQFKTRRIQNSQIRANFPATRPDNCEPN